MRHREPRAVLRAADPPLTFAAFGSGYIDHLTLSSDAYLKFIEDDFLGGARLDPKTNRRPDPRPDVREDESILGNIDQDFNLDQSPRRPVLLATKPASDSATIPTYFRGRPRCTGCTTHPPPAPPRRLRVTASIAAVDARCCRCLPR